MHARNLRWTLCATDRCFRNPVTSAFFKCVKVLPVSRGEGIYQKGMDVAIAKLNRGGWVHIFPEGSRSRDGGRTMGSIKRGTARLVLDADNPAMVVPFVHVGMQEIMPIGATLPRIGKTVTILVGDPIDFTDVRDMEQENIPKENLYDAVSARIGDRLIKLKAQVDKLAHLQTDVTLRQEETLYGGYEQDSEHLKVGFSYQGSGFVSKIRGYMDPTELMSFAARGLFMNQSVEGIRPLRAWNSFWKQVHQSHGVPAMSMLA